MKTTRYLRQRKYLAELAKTTIFLLLVLNGAIGHAQTRPYSLVCFERSELIHSLDEVVNQQQFLCNDSILRNRGCGFAQIPVGSTARFYGFHQSKNRFIFPLFRIAYAKNGQKMYAADGIFRAEHWRVGKRCGGRPRSESCLKPITCGALDGIVSAPSKSLPSYVVIPRFCREFTVEEIK